MNTNNNIDIPNYQDIEIFHWIQICTFQTDTERLLHTKEPVDERLFCFLTILLSGLSAQHSSFHSLFDLFLKGLNFIQLTLVGKKIKLFGN